MPPRPGFGKYDARRGFSHVGRGRDCYPHLRLAQRRGVVGTIAAHADRISVPLKCLNEAEFLFGEDACINGEIVGTDAFGKRAGRTYARRPGQ